MNILGHWKPPPKMNKEQYRRYRIRLVVIMLMWLTSAISIIFFWDSLIWIVRIIVIGVCILITPDLASVRQLFVPYERYIDEGIN